MLTIKKPNYEKLFIAASVAGFLISSLANAKTSGNYVGLDIIRTSVEEGETTLGGTSFGDNFFETGSEDQVSFGLNYKYAFNFKNFFIAPGVLFDYSNISLSNPDVSSNNFDLDYRYGLKVDAGYDITDKFALFVNTALIQNVYTLSNAGGTDSGSDSSASYGFGAKYSVSDVVDVSLAYEMSEYTLTDINQDTVDFDVDTLRVGLAYKF